MQKKLAHVKYVAVEFAYDHFKNGEDAVNDAIGNGYQVMPRIWVQILSA